MRTALQVYLLLLQRIVYLHSAHGIKLQLIVFPGRMKLQVNVLMGRYELKRVSRMFNWDMLFEEHSAVYASKCESNAIKLEKKPYTSRAMWIVFAADTRQFIHLFIVQIRISLVPICT